jgi:hypothetical protein
MKVFLTVVFCTLLIVSWGCSSKQYSTITFDYQSAEAMLTVIEAIHDNAESETVEKLLDTTLKMEAYVIAGERYTRPGQSVSNQVTLEEYKKFILSFLEDSVDIQGKRRLGFMKDLYLDAIKNPAKYKKTLNNIKSIKDSEVQEAFKIASHWLPDGLDRQIKALMIFDLGGGGWQYKTIDDRQVIAFNILVMLDKDGDFDKDVFLGTLAHELNHVGIPINSYYENINYTSLADTSKLKLYTDFVKSLIVEGMAQKFCTNAPNKFTGKPYPEKEFAVIEQGLKDWDFFTSEFVDIHERAKNDLTKIVENAVTDPATFNSAFRNYWTWNAGKLEGKSFVQGRRYYYGSELLGVINEGLGREALFVVIYDFRKLFPLFNKAMNVLKPAGYEKYLFSDSLIMQLEKL